MEIEEILEEELTDAVNNLVIEDGDDEQEKLREMIVGLQYSAFVRGVDMSKKRGSYEEIVSAECIIGPEDATAMMTAFMKNGQAVISLTVRDE